MVITALIIVVALVALIWIFVELKRFKHKVFAIFLVVLIVLSYVSFVAVFKDKNIDWREPSELKRASLLYFSWLGSVFQNLKSITTHAIDLEWSAQNQSSYKK